MSECLSQVHSRKHARTTVLKIDVNDVQISAIFLPIIVFSFSNEMPSESSSDVDLPPDVVSSGGSADAESPVELPETADHPCCKKSCLDHVPKAHKESAEKMKLDLAKLDLKGKNIIWFNQLLNMNREHPVGQRRRMFFWRSHALCLNGFSFLTGCNWKKIRGFLKLIAQGECVPAMDGRFVPRKRPEIKRDDVDAFFCSLYEHLAEPLANLPDTSGDEAVDSADVGTAVALPTWMQDLESVLQTVVVVAEGKQSKSTVQKKWLPTMTPAELFDLYMQRYAPNTRSLRFPGHVQSYLVRLAKRLWYKSPSSAFSV